MPGGACRRHDPRFGFDRQTPNLSQRDTYQQAVAAISIAETALLEAGASLEAVVRTVTYVTDIAEYPMVARAHSEAFGDIRPAATLVEVSALIAPELSVEIEMYAQVNPVGG